MRKTGKVNRKNDTFIRKKLAKFCRKFGKLIIKLVKGRSNANTVCMKCSHLMRNI